MGYLTDYVKEYGKVSFKERPFDEVDALVLAQFIYLKWENIIPKLTDNKDGLTVDEMGGYMQESGLEAEVFMDDRYEADNRALWEGMYKSVRYGDMICNYLVAETDKAIETQFMAITVFPKDTLPVIVYRGTDEKLLGWKEDFNMAYRAPVPGQTLSSLYIKQVALRLEGGFMTAGHSKGGNLAVYSVMTAPKALRDRAMKMYNFDGPGFKSELMEEYDYADIADRICKIVPESSLVGVTLERDDHYKTVTSTAIGGAQHNPYTWQIYEGRFDYIADVNPASRVFRDSITNWMDTSDDEELELFFGTVYKVLSSGGVKTTREITKDKKEASKNMLRAMINLPDDTKEKIKAVMKDFKIQL